MSVLHELPVAHRVNILEEANGENTEEALICREADFGDIPWIQTFFRVVMIWSLLRGGTRSPSFVQNVTRGKAIISIPMFFMLVAVCLKSTPKATDLMERWGISKSNTDRLNGLWSLVSLVLFLSGRLAEVQPEKSMAGTCPTHLSTTARVSSTEFISRFLVLNSLSSLAFMTLPYFNLREIRDSLTRRLLPSLYTSDNSVLRCVYCGSDSIVFPQVASDCGHLYCYFCSRKARDPVDCVKCGKYVSGFRPYVS